MFFFTDYEGTRQIAKAYSASTLPTQAQRSGQFGVALRNPLTGKVYADGNVPTADFSPLAALVFAALPATNAHRWLELSQFPPQHHPGRQG